MWMYEYPEELTHYGVPGMKWGHRKAAKYAARVRTARTSAAEWEEMASAARAKGKIKRADKYTQNAQKDYADADKLQTKLDKKVTKKYSKVGINTGKSEYWRDKGDKAYESHERNAKVLDKTAKQLESEGKYLRAEAARKSADALRSRGANVRAEQYKVADAYLRRSNKLEQKASSFATAANTELGKNKINSILKSSSKKGYDRAKSTDEFQREREIHDRLGDEGYNAYNKIRGTR